MAPLVRPTVVAGWFGNLRGKWIGTVGNEIDVQNEGVSNVSIQSRLVPLTRAGSDLTPRQRQIYLYTRTCLASRGYGPTVREIAVRFQLRSPAGVRRHLRRLQELGYVQCVQFTQRAIQLVPSPRAHLAHLAVVPRGPRVRLVEGRLMVDFGLGAIALGRQEARRLAGQLRLLAGPAGERTQE